MSGKLERNRTQVIRDLATGRPQAEIAREIGIDPASVCRFAKREDVKEGVEKEALRLLESLPDAVGNIKNLIAEMKELPKEDYKSRELSYKASVKALEAAGILNAQTQNHIMINILNDNRTLISPLIEALLTQRAYDFPKDPIEGELAENNE